MIDSLYTFILVDDEKEIRESIRDTIPWNDLGFSFAGACANGYEALELAERIQPDAVLTDINMPFLDGLSFTDRLLTVSPDTKVLIISGYDDFEYARKALQLKVYDYIVKPVTPGELKAILEKLRAALDKDREERLNMKQIKEQLAQSMPLLRERFLSRLIEGKPDGEVIRERIRYFNLPLPVEGAVYLCLVFDFVRRRGGEKFDIDLLAQRNILEKFLNTGTGMKTVEQAAGILFRDRDDRLVILLSGKDKTHLYREGLRIAEGLCRDLLNMGFKETVIGIGEIAGKMEDIPRSFDTAADALTTAVLRGKSGITAYRELTGKAGVSLSETPQWDRRILSALKAGDREGASGHIREMVSSFRNTPFTIEGYHRNLTLVLTALIQCCVDLEIPETAVFPPSADPFAEIISLENLEAVEFRLTGFIEHIIQYIETRQDNFAQIKVREALDYLESHYADPNLSLGTLCKKLDISMSYFSAVFKKYHDKTFVEELTAIRLNKAMELLRTTDMLSYEIADKIGYRDAHYFSLSFRKYAGVTTTEYRNSDRGSVQDSVKISFAGNPNAPP